MYRDRDHRNVPESMKVARNKRLITSRGKHPSDVACGHTNILGIRGEGSALQMLTLGATSPSLLHFSADMESARNRDARERKRERGDEGR